MVSRLSSEDRAWLTSEIQDRAQARAAAEAECRQQLADLALGELQTLGRVLRHLGEPEEFVDGLVGKRVIDSDG